MSTTSYNILRDIILVVLITCSNYFFNYFMEKKKFKRDKFLENKKFNRELYFKTKEKTDEAYIKIYTSLFEVKKYYTLFIEPGNELKDGENFKKFAPLPSILKLKLCIEENELYINENFKIKINELLTTLGNDASMALSLSGNPEYYNATLIENASNETILEIDSTIESIKKRFQEETYL